MKRYKSASWMFLLAVITCAVPGIGAADESVSPIRAVESALRARDVVISDMTTNRMRFVVQESMNHVVHASFDALRGHGAKAVADRLEDGWNRDFADYLIRKGVRDLGDHRPLLQWLATLYRILEFTLGKETMHRGLLGDVYDLNYAIPVSFAPAGEWRTGKARRDAEEYRAHFVPLADVVTYWSTLAACDRALGGVMGPGARPKLCLFVAQKLRQASHHFVAPKLSDYVFYKSNDYQVELGLTRRDVVYSEARELLREYESRRN